LEEGYMSKCFTNYYGLIFNCPIGSEVDSCGYKRIRQLTSKERLTYYDALTENEKNILIEKHQKCIYVREKRPFFTNRNNVD